MISTPPLHFQGPNLLGEAGLCSAKNGDLSAAEASPTVMVVEDEPFVMDFLKIALTAFGYQVQAATNGSTAISQLAKAQPDLVITDYSLGDMSGADLIDYIQACYPNIPLIGMSGEHWTGTQMLAAGARVFVPKPLELESLIAILAKTLAKGRQPH